MSLVERFKRVDAETLLYEYTVTDPATWVRPWTAQLPMKRNPDKMYQVRLSRGELQHGGPPRRRPRARKGRRRSRQEGIEISDH